MKVLVAFPSSGTVKSGFAFSLATLTAAAKYLADHVPGESFALSLARQDGSVIHGNRESLVMDALKTDSTHILFIDDDMEFHPKAAALLLSRRLPIVAVNYCMKTREKTFVAVSKDGARRVQTTIDSTGLEEVAYTGFGLCLIELEVFRKTPQPWFLPLWVADQKCYTTEDNPFFARAREAGFLCWVDHEASKLVSHVGAKAFKWDDPEVKANG